MNKVGNLRPASNCATPPGPQREKIMAIQRSGPTLVKKNKKRKLLENKFLFNTFFDSNHIKSHGSVKVMNTTFPIFLCRSITCVLDSVHLPIAAYIMLSQNMTISPYLVLQS